MPKTVALISPNPSSLYSTSVSELLMRNDIKIDIVFVKKFTLTRFKDEFSRDRWRLLKKIWKKLILRKRAYDDYTDIETILDLRNNENISLRNLKELQVYGSEVYFVDDLNSNFVENKLKQKQVDLTVYTGGGLIRKNILDNAGAGVLNCHMGILPKYRGMDVVEWPLLNKDFKNLGVTIHFMDKGVDTGDILKVFEIELLKGDTIKTLRARFEPIMVKSFVQTIVAFLNGEIIPTSQAEADGKQYYIIDEHLQAIADDNLQVYTKN